MYRLFVKSPEGEEIELVSTEDKSQCEGAKLGAQALFNLFADDFDLEDNYSFVVRQVEGSTSKYYNPDHSSTPSA